MEQAKTAATWLTLITAIGSLVWSAAKVQASVEGLEIVVAELEQRVDVGREERIRIWTMACQANEIPMQDCF